jgi:hypothetical protein
VLNNFAKFGIGNVTMAKEADSATPTAPLKIRKVPNVSMLKRKVPVVNTGVSRQEFYHELVTFLQRQPNGFASRATVIAHFEAKFGKRFTEKDRGPDHRYERHWHHRLDTARSALSSQGVIRPTRETGPGNWQLTTSAAA